MRLKWNSPQAAIVAAAVAAGAVLLATLLGYPFVVLVIVVGSVCAAGWWLRNLGRNVRKVQREHFFGGVCLQCGYDTRYSGHRCSECGAAIWSPDKPLAMPDTLWPDAPHQFTAFVAPSEVIGWMLELRRPTPWQAWGEDPNFRRVATTLIQYCRPCEEGPFGRYLPCDPFHVLPASATAGSFTRMINETLNVELTPEDLYAIENMTIGQVAEMIAGRVPAKRFYTRLSSESDRAA